MPARVSSPSLIPLNGSHDGFNPTIGDARTSRRGEDATVCIDFSSPNMGKELAFHHLRGTMIGASLSKLYDSVAGSRELVARARGVLVFPSVVGASLGVGAEYGRGALRVDGRTQAYYSTTAGSIGLQAGAQSKAVIYLFNTEEALNKFRNSKGWTAGADATVAAATLGANGSIDTNTIRQPVVGFVLTNVGLEAGISLQGAKITEVQP